ncbi:hypothetical protein TKK_0017664 [Trichogramma kaykai]
MRLSLKQIHTLMHESLVRCNNKVTEARRDFAQKHPRVRPIPSRSSFYRLIETLNEHVIVDPPRKQRIKPGVNGPHRRRVLATHRANTKRSIRTISCLTDTPPTSVFNILKSHKLKAFKPIPVQKLRQTDYEARITFFQWALEFLDENENFFSRVCFTDESTFIDTTYKNQQLRRQWSHKNQHWIDERKHFPGFKIMVWIGIIGDQFVGPFFFLKVVSTREFMEHLSEDTLFRDY